MKTARFSALVGRCGRPEVHLTWSAPLSDRVLQSAAQRHRVLSVHQQARGAQKDFGRVGLEPGPHVQFLVFPRSLRPFLDRRIVGIDYDLLDPQLSSGGQLPKTERRASRTAADPKKVIPFAVPAGEEAAKDKSVKIRGSPPPVLEESVPEETDPVKREIKRALADLQVRHLRKVRQRLTALLHSAEAK